MYPFPNEEYSQLPRDPVESILLQLAVDSESRGLFQTQSRPIDSGFCAVIYLEHLVGMTPTPPMRIPGLGFSVNLSLASRFGGGILFWLFLDIAARLSHLRLMFRSMCIWPLMQGPRC